VTTMSDPVVIFRTSSEIEANVVRGLAAARRLLDEGALRRLCLGAPSAILDGAPAERV